MPEISAKADKRLRLAGFIGCALIIGTAVFLLAQLMFLLLLPDIEDSENSTGFLGHNYCGTFFIEQNVENTYGDEATHAAALQAKEEGRTAFMRVASSAAVALLVFAIGAVYMFLRQMAKGQLFKRGGLWLIISGAIFAAYGIANAFYTYYAQRAEVEYLIGVPATQQYYFAAHNVLGLPALIIMAGLLIRRGELAKADKSVKGISAAMRAFAYVFAGGALGFIFYRLCVRVYELMLALAEWDNNARLPFYNLTLELPRELANTSQGYMDVVTFRFLKDLPVFLAAGFTAVMLCAVMLSAAAGEVNTPKNRTRLILSILALAIASVLFNAMGLHEIGLFNENFIGIYGSVTYTPGIRGLCEPGVFALIIWVIMLLEARS